MKKAGYSCVVITIITITSFVMGCNENDYRIFEDVTVASGIFDTGMTFGASWGDFDGDGLPDLYTSNHANPAVLYQNLGKGSFKDVTAQYISPDDLKGDKHGATWMDYDNDGDKDLLVLRGGGRGVGVGPNSFYVNLDNGFEERAEALGIDNPYARTRMQLFYDFDNDGYLDVFLGALKRQDGKAPASIFYQKNGTFSPTSKRKPFATASVPFCILALLNSDDKPELVCRVQGVNDRSGQIFSTTDNVFSELELLPRTHFNDIASGDFDGDLKMDLYLARKSPDRSILLNRRGINKVIADFKGPKKNIDNNWSVSFQTSGEVSFELRSAPTQTLLLPENIHIGMRGLNPLKHTFTLNQDVAGITETINYSPGKQLSVYIKRSEDNVWDLNVAANAEWASVNLSEPLQVTIKITSTEKIDKLNSRRVDINTQFSADRLLMNVDGLLKEEGDVRGVNDPLMDSVNVVAGDFDNDMDLDLYIVSSTSIENLENKLLINDGHGNFKPVIRAGGAPGTRTGVGDAVAMADYDMDGFLDLLVMNGGSMGRSYGLSASDGGYQLYHNMGNDNHWLEIDLEGTQSNRDGVGAVVYVTSGGVTQIRIQDGGVHNRVQNHQRLHFGLAQNKSIEKITIMWPSGIVQELKNIQVDQLLHVKES